MYVIIWSTEKYKLVSAGKLSKMSKKNWGSFGDQRNKKKFQKIIKLH